MSTTSKYNKSEIMKKAWSIHRSKWCYATNFSMCLKRAWEVTKQNIADKEREAAIMAAWNQPRTEPVFTEERQLSTYEAKVATMASYYASGAYSGD